jgi:hypothetical protein
MITKVAAPLAHDRREQGRRRKRLTDDQTSECEYRQSGRKQADS